MGGKFAKPASKRKRRRSGLSRRNRRWLPRQKSGITAAGKKKTKQAVFEQKRSQTKKLLEISAKETDTSSKTAKSATKYRERVRFEIH